MIIKVTVVINTTVLPTGVIIYSNLLFCYKFVTGTM